METSGEGSENARKVKNGKGKPDWAKSKIYHQKDGKKVIEVQFDFEEIAIPEHLKTEKLEKSSVLQTLILFPKPDGSYIPYFLNIYPDSPDKKFKLQDFMEGGYQKIPQDFSGVYRFYRWNGNFISGWRIKEGVKTHRIKESKRSNQADKSARTSSFTLYCYELVTTWYQYSCSETFGCTEPIAIGETVSGTECDLVVAPPSPSNPGESGGGGGGTPPNTGENCEEPEGNLEGVTVDCDEEEIAPGDRLCLSSFGNISGGSENSFWQGNLKDLKFENGQSVNQFSFYFALSNGISDFAMNMEQIGTIINTAGGSVPRSV